MSGCLLGVTHCRHDPKIWIWIVFKMTSNKKTFTASGITARLFERIAELPEEKQKELMVLIGDQRESERTAYIMQVIYETQEECFSDFILDISPGGIFLETVEDLFIGQRLIIHFKFKNLNEPVTVAGCIAWKGVHGIGIRFVFDSREQKQAMEDQIQLLK